MGLEAAGLYPMNYTGLKRELPSALLLSHLVPQLSAVFKKLLEKGEIGGKVLGVNEITC